MMTDYQILEVVAAHKEGKKIQVQSIEHRDFWYDEPNPQWDFSYHTYRVAPEPRKPREWNVIVNEEGNINWGFKYDHRFMGGVRVREVLE